MSRCFPFPPPGYEKKPLIDDPDLLKKEKRREKKHKKDKKDKEKKDGKEKREKDRSKRKHKEKKDKHRDKKKDKEKSETSTPYDNNINGQFKGYNGERLHHNNEQSKEKIDSTDGKKTLTPFAHQNGDLLRNKIKVGDTENFKFVQELDRRIKAEEKGMGSHQFLVEGRKNNVNKVETQKTNGRQVFMDGAAGFSGSIAVPSRINGATPPPLDNRRIEKMQEKVSDDKWGDKWKNEDRDKQKQEKDKEMVKANKMEKLKGKSEQMKAERAKNKHIMKSDLVAVVNNSSTHSLENNFLGVGNEGLLKKRKDMEINGVSHENEFRPNKMARPISNISPENGRKLDFSHSLGPSLLDKQVALQNSLKDSTKGGQRVNGMITSQPVSVSGKKPPIPAFNNVLSKPSPVKSPPVITNNVPTTKPQPNHIAALSSALKPPPSIPNPIASHHQPASLSSPPPPPTPLPPTTGEHPMIRPKPPPAVVNKMAPPPLPIPKKKPPHPDAKYLNQILSVPKPDQWCSFDDQEWLLSSKPRPMCKKPPIDEPEVQVWSEAKHIESADICALPYVIPY